MTAMKEFVYTVQVAYDEVDATGIVHHSNYLRYFERARNAWLWQRGLALDKLAQQGLLFVIKEANLHYMKPARYRDWLEVITRIQSARRVSLQYLQQIRAQQQPERIICAAEIMVVSVNSQFRPCAIPKPMIEGLIE